MMEFLISPDFTFLLMCIGLYGLIYELVSPGAFLPGITGALCLLLGMFAINEMHVNYFGLLLMIIGISCMTAEAFFRTFGALGGLGAISFAIGGILFVNRGVSPWLIGSMTLISLGVLSFGLKRVLRTRKRSVSTGVEGLRNTQGEVIHWSRSKGEVLAAGAVWKARSSDDHVMKKGDKVKIIDINGLCLIIEPSHQTS
ncbi:MAG: hypothetical protein HY052_01090 [Proteobacteria bacterium]|nr:hypothetical protein [Pseudomonadota bacterium]